MANEYKKDFNQMLINNKNMPKIVKLDNDAAKRWGGSTMVVAPPIDYDAIIREVSYGKVTTTTDIRCAIAKKYKTDITCPMTAGIFINICAWANYQ